MEARVSMGFIIQWHQTLSERNRTLETPYAFRFHHRIVNHILKQVINSSTFQLAIFSLVSQESLPHCHRRLQKTYHQLITPPSAPQLPRITPPRQEQVELSKYCDLGISTFNSASQGELSLSIDWRIFRQTFDTPCQPPKTLKNRCTCTQWTNRGGSRVTSFQRDVENNCRFQIII